MARVYLDSNATTRLRPEVLEAYVEALRELGGNASSLHAPGRAARHMLDSARERCAAALGVHEDEIVFTSGGTEANNLAVLGALRAAESGAGLAVGATEHSSVLAPARELEREGRPLRVLPVDSTGTLELGAVHAVAADPRCALVAVMAANNEIGTCAPLDELAASWRALERRPLLLVDAVQAVGRIPLKLREWGVDLASFSAHKLGGPVGVGVLFRRAGVVLRPLMFGGEQEHGLRPGTEDVAGVLATALALELAVAEQGQHAQRLNHLTSLLWGELGTRLPHVRLLGLPLGHARRLPGTLNLLAPEHDGKVLVMRLDLEGIACSAGSACASGSLEPSHVLLALGCSEREARTGLRLSLGRESSAEAVHKAVDILGRTLGAIDAKRGARTGL